MTGLEIVVKDFVSSSQRRKQLWAILVVREAEEADDDARTSKLGTSGRRTSACVYRLVYRLVSTGLLPASSLKTMASDFSTLVEQIAIAREHAVDGGYDSALIYYNGVIAQINK